MDGHTSCIDNRLLNMTHLIWLHWDNSTQGKDEWVDILHVQIIGCYGIRDGVVGKDLERQ